MTDNRPNNYNWRGWQKLHDEYVAKIEAAGARVTYAKQKYGYLCFEVDCKGVTNKGEEIYRLIDEAEEKSLCICENCGSEEKDVGKVEINNWIKTLCPKCVKNEKAWSFAVGIVQTEGVKPSDFMMGLIEQEKRGEIKREDIKRLLIEHYTVKQSDIATQDLIENHEVAIGEYLRGETVDHEDIDWEDGELSENDLRHIRLGEQELATGTHGDWSNIKKD